MKVYKYTLLLLVLTYCCFSTEEKLGRYFQNNDLINFEKVLNSENFEKDLDKKTYYSCLKSILQYRVRDIGKSFLTLKETSLYLHDSTDYKNYNKAVYNYNNTLGNLLFNLNCHIEALRFYKSAKDRIDNDEIKTNIILCYYYTKNYKNGDSLRLILKDHSNTHYVNCIRYYLLKDKDKFNFYYNSPFLKKSDRDGLKYTSYIFEKCGLDTLEKLYFSTSEDVVKNNILELIKDNYPLNGQIKEDYLNKKIYEEKSIREEYSKFISSYLSNSNYIISLENINEEKERNFKYLTACFLAVGLSSLFLIYLVYYTKKMLKKENIHNEQMKKKELELQSTIMMKDNMLSIISHDIKNPLTSMKLTLETLILYFSKPEVDIDKIKTIVYRLNSTFDSCLRMALNLLDYSESVKGNHIENDVNIVDIVNLNHHMVSNAIAEKNISIKYDLRNVKINTDKTLFDTIYRNLLHNAVKYTKVGGEIKITLNSKNLIISNESENSLPQSIIDNLKNPKFKRNDTTKGTKGEGGTGYGLMIVNEIINVLNLKMEYRYINYENKFIIKIK